MLIMPVSMLDRAGADAPPEIPLAPPGTRLTTLANGLTVIVREDHTAPVVSAQAWCKAGSIDDLSVQGVPTFFGLVDPIIFQFL